MLAESRRAYREFLQGFQDSPNPDVVPYTTIDKMDRYTAGHSERVAGYAVVLAEWLGLSANQIEIVRQSALMHDIGKIGIPRDILDSRRRLTDEEMNFDWS